MIATVSGSVESRPTRGSRERIIERRLSISGRWGMTSLAESASALPEDSAALSRFGDATASTVPRMKKTTDHLVHHPLDCTSASTTAAGAHAAGD